MIIVDANILLSAYNREQPDHVAVSAWLTRLLESTEVIGLPWISMWAFLRIATNKRLWRQPMEPRKCLAIVEDWLAQPGVFPISPGPRHAEILRRLVADHQAYGPLVTDAALAALAIEQGAVLASLDQDFSRFPELRWVNPLATT